MVANPSGAYNPGGMAHLRSIPAMMNIHILMIQTMEIIVCHHFPSHRGRTTFASVPETEIILYAPSEDILGNPLVQARLVPIQILEPLRAVWVL